MELFAVVDPNLLRPNWFEFYHDKDGTMVCLACSEKQGADAGMQVLERQGLVKGAQPDLEQSMTAGVVVQLKYDPETGAIEGWKLVDREGKDVTEILPAQEHYQPPQAKAAQPAKDWVDISTKISRHIEGYPEILYRYITTNLNTWDYNTYHWALQSLVDISSSTTVRMSLEAIKHAIQILTDLYDRARFLDVGNKARASIKDITLKELYKLFSVIPYRRITKAQSSVVLEAPNRKTDILVVDATGFKPEGTNPAECLAMFLNQAYDSGWRKFIVYNLTGQRFMGMGMGDGPTPDVEIDLYGSSGEYTGAFNMGSTIRAHGHTQNFTAMVSHTGRVISFGHTGKVMNYASEGGQTDVYGDVVDRALVNGVNNALTPEFRVFILGTAAEHIGQALMGGRHVMMGLRPNAQGELQTLPTPYAGGKILAGSAAGEIVIFDPEKKVKPAQFEDAQEVALTDDEWKKDYLPYILAKFNAIGLGTKKDENTLVIRINGQDMEITKEHFRRLKPARKNSAH
jgi:hypothetical protein